MLAKSAALAVNGGKPAVQGTLAPFVTVGKREAEAAYDAVLRYPLSGYLGGNRYGGYHVEKLEEAWRETFQTKHAIACNSATSGLLMACVAAGVGQGSVVATSPFTMSGTIAPAVLLGADVDFGDIEEDCFVWRGACCAGTLILPNIFGHPSIGKMTNIEPIVVIEDNAQAIYAKVGDKYAGTIGHMGVWSLNVHKHIQCGEGGIVTTDSDDLADKLRLFRNHGELAGGAVGLNLRMVEMIAAVALVQLRKAKQIVAERIEIAEALTEQVKNIPGIIPPKVREGCTHSYYVWAPKTTLNRARLVEALNAEGFPIRAGYVEPLYRLPAFRKFERKCPVAERMHDVELMTYENCGYSPTTQQIKQIGEAFCKVTEAIS